MSPLALPLLILFLHILTSTASPDYFILVNPQTGFALDASDDFLKLQKLLGHDYQLWTLESARNGQYYIVNKATGKLLDSDFRWLISNSYVILGNRIADFACPIKDSKRNDSCQKWYIHHGGHIVSGCGGFAYAVDTRSLKLNVKVETYALNEGEYQKFAFQYV